MHLLYQQIVDTLNRAWTRLRRKEHEGVEHGAVGEAGVDAEVTVKMSLHWRTGLWLTPETQQQGSPLLKLPSQLRIYIVS